MPSLPSIKPARALAALTLLCLAVAGRADDAAVRDAIAKELADPILAHGWTGVLVKSLDNYRVIFSQNADRLFIPASNNKLVVSSCVTDTLPPDFHYTTPVLRDGTLENGVLKGNLYLKGSGDSTLEAKDLRALARAVREAGITRVEGDIVGDGSAFDDNRLGYGWAYDDLPAYYAAEISGLTVDRGTVRVVVTPGNVGEAPKVSLDPDAGYMLVRSTATTVPDAQRETLSVGRLVGTNIITVSGGIRRGNKDFHVPVTMTDPAAYTAYLFRMTLRDQGIPVTGSARTGVSPEGAARVAAHDSQNLPQILSLLNKPSDNLIAESLVKTLGLVKKGQGSTDAGLDFERDYLKRIGVDTDVVDIVDGSGLSRHNLLTPDAIVTILTFMWTHPNREVFIPSLPVAGVDGTLRRRMLNTAAQGKVMAKTGYVGKARCLSGYVTSKDGEVFVFSMMMNHYTGETSKVNGIQDRICEILANSSR